MGEGVRSDLRIMAHGEQVPGVGCTGEFEERVEVAPAAGCVDPFC